MLLVTVISSGSGVIQLIIQSVDWFRSATCIEDSRWSIKSTRYELMRQLIAALFWLMFESMLKKRLKAQRHLIFTSDLSVTMGLSMSDRYAIFIMDSPCFEWQLEINLKEDAGIVKKYWIDGLDSIEIGKNKIRMDRWGEINQKSEAMKRQNGEYKMKLTSVKWAWKSTKMAHGYE